MALNSYSALKDSVAAWLDAPELVTRIPDFIALAEAVINRRVDHRLMVGVVSLSVSNGRAMLPGDFTAVRAVSLSGRRQDFMTLDAYAAGARQGYTLAGGELLFAQAVSGTATLIYARQVPPLAENGENWLLDAFPDVYLYGALSQAAPYLADNDRAATWAQLFEKALAGINADGQAQSFGGTLQTHNAQQVY